MSVKENISRLKYISLCLFLAASIAIVGSLIFHNFLVNFMFKPVAQKLDLLKEIPGDYVEIFCDESNNYCEEPKLFQTLTLQNNTLDTCFKYYVKYGYIIDGKKEYGLVSNNDAWVIKEKSITSKNFKIFLENLIELDFKFKCKLNLYKNSIIDKNIVKRFNKKNYQTIINKIKKINKNYIFTNNIFKNYSN